MSIHIIMWLLLIGIMSYCNEWNPVIETLNILYDDFPSLVASWVDIQLTFLSEKAFAFGFVTGYTFLIYI
jgi:hypothetical protein